MWSTLPKTQMCANLKPKINPLRVRSRDESIGTTLDPLFFMLDNISKTKLL
jgi:hypothetical protein